MKKLEHIGIAVKNLETSKALFASLLGVSCYKVEDVPAEGVRTAFFEISGVKIELLEATRDDSPIASFINKRGEGLHHLAFEVDGLNAKIEELDRRGFTWAQKEIRNGADNKLVCFMHPRSTGGVLIELCQDVTGGEV
jgi:methylmalonyl-CoA/ethylmalonyl-CoA epimerase